MVESGQMRVTLILYSGDDPRLFEELERFPKGPRRAHRLRALALEGLLASSKPSAFKQGIQQEGDDLALAAAELLSPPQ